MPITFDCPECLRSIRVSDDLAGRAGGCPHCKEPVRVPGTALIPNAAPTESLSRPGWRHRWLISPRRWARRQWGTVGILLMVGCGVSWYARSSYTIIRDEVVSDTIIRTQIEIDLLIEGRMSRPRIEKLLHRVFNEASRRRVFESAEYANCVVVTAYVGQDWREHTRDCSILARRLTVPANQTPELIFSTMIHDRLMKGPERKWGFSESERRLIFRKLCDADYRAMVEADQRVPVNLLEVVKPGDFFVLSKDTVLMGDANSEEWAASGMRSRRFPAGTQIRVVRTLEEGGMRWAEVGARHPQENEFYHGFMNLVVLGPQHPSISTSVAYKATTAQNRLLYQMLFDKYKNEVLRTLRLDPEIAAKIETEGVMGLWPE